MSKYKISDLKNIGNSDYGLFKWRIFVLYQKLVLT